MSDFGVPEELIIGRTRGEWPIAVWEDEVHALYWLEQKPDRRVLYRVKVEVLGEYGRVPAVPAKLAFIEVPRD
jgi:hypothetical protein